MKKAYNPISDVRNESVELSRRLYRAISDVSRHLDDCRGRSQTCNDLFSPSVETQRMKLREYCERLIFSDPVGYGRKGEELLWRKGYYDVVTTAKRLRKNNTWSPLEVAHMQGHLAAGVGHYHHLLFRLQIEFKLDLRGIVDFPLLIHDGLMKDKVSPSGHTLDSGCIDWASQAAHRCLVYLGDLSRYFLDLHPHWDSGLATRYYLQALNMNVDIGMPHNQLGTLSGTCSHGLEAAYHYMRCLTCRQPFEGAEGNLRRLLGRNMQWLEEHQHSSQILEVEDTLSVHRAEHIHRLIARFLLLIDIWFFDKTSPIESHQVCHQMIQDVQHCLTYTKPFPGTDDCDMKEGQLDLEQLSLCRGRDGNQDSPEYLRDDLVFKMTVMSLLCVTKLQTTGSQKVSDVIAFTLTLFSQLVQQVIDHIQDSVFNISFRSFASPAALELNLTAPSGGSSNINTMNVSEQPSVAVNGCAGGQEARAVSKKKRSKRLQRLRKRRRRRRRRLNTSEDSDPSDGEYPYGDGSSSSDEEKSDISENTEPGLDLSSDDDEDDDDDDDDDLSKELHANSDSSILSEFTVTNGETHGSVAKDETSKCNGLKSEKKGDIMRGPITDINGSGEREGLVTSSNTSTNLEAVAEKEVNTGDRMKNGEMLDPADMIELLAEEGMLDAVKICTDWLHGDSDIIKACGHSSPSLSSRFIVLLNLINVSAEAFGKESGVGQFLKLKHIKEIFRKVPLPEDVMLKGLPVMKSSHAALDWEYLRHHCLNAKEEALLRVYKLVEFGHLLASIPDTGVSYDSEQKLFSIAVAAEVTEDNIKETVAVNQLADVNDSGTNSHLASSSNPNSSARRGQLMHHMGQLWLRAEVHDLESRVRRRCATFSPYLAVDSDALIHHMHLVKQLVGARKFIILIPSVVVSALDELKREIGRARETIRWLESQFQRGNRFLRAQRSHESLPVPLIKYPKKKDKEAWLFFQVVECCHYFSQKTGVHDRQPETALVTLLTGQKSYVCGGSTSSFSSLGVAKSAGINLEHIESFYAKWKTSSKSHG